MKLYTYIQDFAVPIIRLGDTTMISITHGNIQFTLYLFIAFLHSHQIFP
jgi:hypothetical protein